MDHKRLGIRKMAAFGVGVFALVFFLSAGPQASNASAKEYNLRMPNVLGPGTGLWKAGEEFVKRVEKASQGQLKIRMYPPGAIIGPTEVFEAVGRGIVDMAFSTGEYWAGKDPAFAFVTYLPGGFDSPVQHDFWLYERGGKELVDELYEKYNLYCLSLPYYPAEYLQSRVPIRSKADITGKRLVFSGAMSHRLFRDLGAAPSFMPTGERVTALERGVIDGGDLGVPSTTVAIGADRVAKHMLRPPVHQPSSALELIIGKRLWESLPENLQYILETEAYDLAWRTYRYTLELDLKAMEKMRAEGLQEYYLSEEELREIREIAMKAWEEEAQKSDLCRRMLDSQLQVMREFGLLH